MGNKGLMLQRTQHNSLHNRTLRRGLGRLLWGPPRGLLRRWRKGTTSDLAVRVLAGDLASLPRIRGGDLGLSICVLVLVVVNIDLLARLDEGGVVKADECVESRGGICALVETSKQRLEPLLAKGVCLVVDGGEEGVQVETELPMHQVKVCTGGGDHVGNVLETLDTNRDWTWSAEIR